MARVANQGHPPNACRGFTLLELLVVMTLLSLLMTGLISALRTMAQTESKIDQRLQRLADTRVARAFLQQTLSRVSGAGVNAPNTPGTTIVPFVATSQTLIWIGIMPARPGVGGKHFFRLALEDVNAKPELVLRFAPCNVDLSFPDWSMAESRILMPDIVKFDIQAQGLQPRGHKNASNWPQAWQEGWPLTDTLPEQIRLTLEDAQGPWPQWTFQLLPLVHSDASVSKSVSGPL